MKSIFRILTLALLAPFIAEIDAQAQVNIPASAAAVPAATRTVAEIDAYLDSVAADPFSDVYMMPRLPRYFFMPAIYSSYINADTIPALTPTITGNRSLRWVEEQAAITRAMNNMNRTLFFEHPELVHYNVGMLPEAPKQFHAVVNPEEHTIEIVETIPVEIQTTVETMTVKKRHWIHTFAAGLQFSQAYISPNWYQGGNNNLNMLANVLYNVKLNTAYHPNLLFETNIQYKLGINNAPNDDIHDYSISDDIFQINTTFGMKAARRWYYSFTGQFKTQLLNSYNVNSTELRSAFMSPAELTAGIGMTYNYVSPSKNFTFDASIAPLSYKLTTCTNYRMSPEDFGIAAGHKTLNSYGSSTELKLFWKMAYNITYSSRLFGFTDYSTAQADWEHKITFDINRFLSTQVFAHLRYDTSTPRCDDPSWKKLQIKEILSIGFSYKFANL